MAYHLFTPVLIRQAPEHDAATAVESKQVVAWGQNVGKEADSQQNAAPCAVLWAQTYPREHC